MKEENFVYVKLEYGEALESKRDILASQVSLLRIVQMMRHYRLLRLEELKIKAKMHRKIKELVANIKKIKTDLPHIKIPHIKKTDEEKEFRKKLIENGGNEYDNNLEIQLQQIQEKLRDIGG
jgi:lipoate-protein ligase A